jgi:DNA mismatch repair protein MSH2
VKEAIIPTGTVSGTTDRDIDLNKLKAVLERCEVVITERKPSVFPVLPRRNCYIYTQFQVNFRRRTSRMTSPVSSPPKQPKLSERPLQLTRQRLSVRLFCQYYVCLLIILSGTAQLSLPTAPAALAALINYLGLLSHSENHNAYSLRTHDLDQYMKLDASALRALNLVEAPGNAVRPQQSFEKWPLTDLYSTREQRRATPLFSVY